MSRASGTTRKKTGPPYLESNIYVVGPLRQLWHKGTVSDRSRHRTDNPPPEIERTASLARALIRSARTILPNSVIVVEAGPDQGQWRRLTPGTPLRLGRGDDLTFRLTDQDLSRRHAEITWHVDDVWIADLGSKNGTRLDNQLITEPTRWPPDAVVRLGATTLRRVDAVPQTHDAGTRVAARRLPMWPLLLLVAMGLVVAGLWLLANGAPR